MPSAPKVALVTGGARRIGAAIAAGLAADGWAVAVHYRSSSADADRLVARIKDQAGQAVAVAADLTDTADLETLVARAADALGPVGLLVNNASVFDEDAVASVSAESFDRHMAVNLRAPVLLAHAFAAHVPPATSGGIINIIDQRVWRLTPRFLSYTLSKSGLWTATQTLAQALAPRIRVNAIGPGPALANSRQHQADFDAQTQAVPLQRGPALEEFQRAVRFIVETPSLTGQMLALDGGQHLAWRTPDAIGHE